MPVSEPKASDVLEQSFEGERAVKDLLHQLVIVEKALPVKWLAAASGYVESSCYKGLDREAVNGLSIRLLDAAALGSHEIAAALVRLLSNRWLGSAGDVDGHVAVPQALRVIGRASAVQAWIAQACEDNEIDATECEELVRKLDAMDLATKRLRAAIDSLQRSRRLGVVA